MLSIISIIISLASIVLNIRNLIALRIIQKETEELKKEYKKIIRSQDIQKGNYTN